MKNIILPLTIAITSTFVAAERDNSVSVGVGIVDFKASDYNAFMFNVGANFYLSEYIGLGFSFANMRYSETYQFSDYNNDYDVKIGLTTTAFGGSIKGIVPVTPAFDVFVSVSSVFVNSKATIEGGPFEIPAESDSEMSMSFGGGFAADLNDVVTIGSSLSIDDDSMSITGGVSFKINDDYSVGASVLMPLFEDYDDEKYIMFGVSLSYNI